MLKKIIIESKIPETYMGIEHFLTDEKSKCWVEESKFYCEVDSDNQAEYSFVLLNIGMFLMYNYLNQSNICKNKEQQDFVAHHFVKDPSFRYAILIDLMTYFNSNDYLRENVYFMFNFSFSDNVE